MDATGHQPSVQLPVEYRVIHDYSSPNDDFTIHQHDIVQILDPSSLPSSSNASPTSSTTIPPTSQAPHNSEPQPVVEVEYCLVVNRSLGSRNGQTGWIPNHLLRPISDIPFSTNVSSTTITLLPSPSPSDSLLLMTPILTNTSIEPTPLPDTYTTTTETSILDNHEPELKQTITQPVSSTDSLSHVRSAVPSGTKVIVKFPYQAERSDELNLVPDQIVYVLEAPDGGWWRGMAGKGKECMTGWFPSVMVEVIEDQNDDGFNGKEEAGVKGGSGKEMKKSGSWYQRLTGKSTERKRKMSTGSVGEKKKKEKKSSKHLRSISESGKSIKTNSLSSLDQVQLQESAVTTLRRSHSDIALHIEADEEIEQQLAQVKSVPEFSWKSVVASDVLSNLGEMGIKRQDVLWELLLTERNYVSDLELIADVFLRPLSEHNILPSKTVTGIFANWRDLLEINKAFLNQLENARNDSNLIGNVGKIFLSIGDKFIAYTTFCGTFLQARSRLQQAIKSSRYEATSANLPKGMDISSYLIKPAQRVCKYPLLLKELIKVTPETHPDFSDLRAALTKIQKVVTIINQGISIGDQQKKILEIQNSFVEKITLVDPARTLLHEDEITMRIGANHKPRRIFLFNDLVILCRKDWRDRFHLQARASPFALDVIDITDASESNMILLKFPKSDGIFPLSRIVEFTSPSAKSEWLKAYSAVSDKSILSQPYESASSNQTTTETHLSTPETSRQQTPFTSEHHTVRYESSESTLRGVSSLSVAIFNAPDQSVGERFEQSVILNIGDNLTGSLANEIGKLEEEVSGLEDALASRTQIIDNRSIISIGDIMGPVDKDDKIQDSGSLMVIIESLKAEKESVLQQTQDFERQSMEWQTRLDELRAENNRLRSEVDTIKKSQHEQESARLTRLNELSAENNRLRGEIDASKKSQHEQEIARLKEMDSFRKELENAKEKEKTLVTSNAELTARLALLHDKETVLVNKLHELETKLADVEANLQNERDQNISLNQTLNDKSSELQNATIKLSELETRQVKLVEEATEKAQVIESLKQDLARSQANGTRLTKEKEELVSTLTKDKNSMEEAQKLLRTQMQSRIDQTETELEKMRHQVNALEHHLGEKTVDFDVLKKQFDDVTKEKSTVFESLQKLKRDYTSKEKELGEKLSELSKLKNHFDESNISIMSLQNALQEKEDIVASLKQELNSLKDKTMESVLCDQCIQVEFEQPLSRFETSQQENEVQTSEEIPTPDAIQRLCEILDLPLSASFDQIIGRVVTMTDSISKVQDEIKNLTDKYKKLSEQSHSTTEYRLLHEKYTTLVNVNNHLETRYKMLERKLKERELHHTNSLHNVEVKNDGKKEVEQLRQNIRALIHSEEKSGSEMDRLVYENQVLLKKIQALNPSPKKENLEFKGYSTLDEALEPISWKKIAVEDESISEQPKNDAETPTSAFKMVITKLKRAHDNFEKQIATFCPDIKSSVSVFDVLAQIDDITTKYDEDFRIVMKDLEKFVTDDFASSYLRTRLRDICFALNCQDAVLETDTVDYWFHVIKRAANDAMDKQKTFLKTGEENSKLRVYVGRLLTETKRLRGFITELEQRSQFARDQEQRRRDYLLQQAYQRPLIFE